MWEFRKDNTIAATIFSSYGGFLVAFGVVFLPGFGIFQALNSAAILHLALGLFFLCWTIFSGVLFLGSLRTNLALLIVLALMFLSYLFLTIGELAGGSVVLLVIGGWLGIATALVAWYTALADMQLRPQTQDVLTERVRRLLSEPHRGRQTSRKRKASR